MTTELEEQFYKTFEIEPEYNKKSCKHCKYRIESNFFDGCIYDINFINCPNAKMFYPDITTEKLLKMICILSAYNYIFEDLKADNIEQLKEEIIKLFFDYPLIAEEEKAKIQQLFKEGK